MVLGGCEEKKKKDKLGIGEREHSTGLVCRGLVRKQTPK